MKRGSTLIAALLLVALIFVLGLTALSRRVFEARALTQARRASQARQLALAGLADVKAKLQHEINFPPQLEGDEDLFSYTEPVLALDDTTVLGYYTVTIDGRYREPYQVLRLQVAGYLGENFEDPQAESAISADFDIAPLQRGGSNPNPWFYRLRVYDD